MYEKLQKYISNNTDDTQLLPSLKNRKPCIWLSTLVDIENAAVGLYPEFGIDRHFLQIAHAQKKEIIEIESSASQYDAMNRIPDKAYEYLLSIHIFMTEDVAGSSLKDTYAEWKSGTLQASSEGIGTEATDGDSSSYSAALSEYYRILFTERNAVMADAAKSYLDDGKKVFLIIGAEHLLGNDGVIEHLKADGYTLSQLGGKAKI